MRSRGGVAEHDWREDSSRYRNSGRGSHEARGARRPYERVLTVKRRLTGHARRWL